MKYEFLVIWNSLNKLISRYSRSNQLDPSARSVSGYVTCVISSVTHVADNSGELTDSQILDAREIQNYLPADVHYSLLIYCFQRGYVRRDAREPECRA